MTNKIAEMKRAKKDGMCGRILCGRGCSAVVLVALRVFTGLVFLVLEDLGFVHEIAKAWNLVGGVVTD